MFFLDAENLQQSGIAHGFFGRKGGVSTGIYRSLNCGPGSGDDRDAVIENRSRVCETLGVASLVNAGQVHGTNVVTVTKAWPIGATTEDDKKFIPLGDALVTATPGIALGILTADCAPVLFADAGACVIGAAHAGWRGAICGVIRSTSTVAIGPSCPSRRAAARVGSAACEPGSIGRLIEGARRLAFPFPFRVTQLHSSISRGTRKRVVGLCEFPNGSTEELQTVKADSYE